MPLLDLDFTHLGALLCNGLFNFIIVYPLWMVMDTLATPPLQAKGYCLVAYSFRHRTGLVTGRIIYYVIIDLHFVFVEVLFSVKELWPS